MSAGRQPWEGVPHQAHDEDEWPLSEDDTVEDPEALRRAEEAVARIDERPAGGPTDPDETWVPVARDTSEGAMRLPLIDVFEALEAEDVPAGWEPYDPRESVPSPYGLSRVFRVMVPESSLSQARSVLYGVPPEGVEYAWPTGPAAAGPGPGLPTPVTGVGSPFSDNALLARQAAGGGGGIGAALAVFAGLLVVAIALFVLLRG
jgi:hypothetical protein